MRAEQSEYVTRNLDPVVLDIKLSLAYMSLKFEAETYNLNNKKILWLLCFIRSILIFVFVFFMKCHVSFS